MLIKTPGIQTPFTVAIFFVLTRWIINDFEQEKMRGQRGRLPVQALGYVNFTKVILGLPETAGVNFLITFLRWSRNLETAVHEEIRFDSVCW